MKNLLIILIGFSFSFNNILFSQEIQIKKNTIFFEFLGTAATIKSIHYERLLSNKEKWAFHICLGVGYDINKKLGINPRYGFPLTLSWDRGSKNHKMDLGIGLTYNSGIIQVSNQNNPFESLNAL